MKLIDCYFNVDGKNDSCQTQDYCVSLQYLNSENSSYFCSFEEQKVNLLCNHLSLDKNGFFYVLCCNESFCNGKPLNNILQQYSNDVDRFF
ncbi:hypothetical protein HZS_4764 [Henneguya salminicola]|nr:hypothetical protein HZS_4764 [Henneguya salminicola]